MIANDLKKGMTIFYNGEVYEVVDYQHVKPGKGGAFMKTKIKSLKTGTILDVSFRAQEKVEEAFIEKKPLHFNYQDGQIYYFMDENYELIPVEESLIGDKKYYLTEDLECTFWFYQGEIVKILLPDSVVLKVEHTEPGVKGDTASNVTKPAELETGLTIQVPLFVNVGDKVRVDTRSGKYIERV